jgi:stress response protein YsnF
MTTQAEALAGAQVTGADGKVVGTVEQVFRDDVDGTPAWARVRAGKTGRFVPLGNCQVTADGLRVPFDSEKIIGGPIIDVGQHLSAAQAEELGRYYGLVIPAQSRKTTGHEWLIRQEERLRVSKELAEIGRIRLRKYVDVEPVEQTVRVFREEFDVERIPIGTDERIAGNIEEGVLEIILHEERPVLRTETVPVERVRLVPRRVEEDKTYQFEVRRERIEIEPDPQVSGSEPDGGKDLG